MLKNSIKIKKKSLMLKYEKYSNKLIKNIHITFRHKKIFPALINKKLN